MRSLTAVAVILSITAAIQPATVRAQAGSDSARAVIAAIDATLGPAPYDHPGGKASLLCVDIQPTRAWSHQNWSHDPQFVVDVRTELARRVTVIKTCRYVPKPANQAWVVGPAEEPAASITIMSLTFVQSDSADIRLHEARYGRGSRFVECSAAQAADKSWKVKECRTIPSRP